jgi:hypothetical protein
MARALLRGSARWGTGLCAFAKLTIRALRARAAAVFSLLLGYREPPAGVTVREVRRATRALLALAQAWATRTLSR